MRKLTVQIDDSETSLTDQLAEIERSINNGNTSGAGWEVTGW